jgi:hypothetical protein
MTPFYALITPVDPSSIPPGGQQPPWWPGFPAHPIPPTVWPTPPGGAQPPWWPGAPTHPIPPTVWPNPPVSGQPPTGQPPGYPSHPIYYPGFPGAPTHPIPPTIWPDPGPPPGIIVQPPWWPGHPEHPIPPEIWPTPPGPPPGGQTGSISNPIELPPSEDGGSQPGYWALAYFPQLSGWIWVWVPVPGTPATPPSK